MMTSKKRQGNDPGSDNTPGGGNTLQALDDLVGVRKGKETSEFMNGRRSLAYELFDKGLLSSQKLSMEILFLLPDGFIDFYQVLFHRALALGDSSVMHGRSGGLDKAKGAQGIVTGSEVGAQAKGSGKRWKNPAYTVGDERALEVKEFVDRELMRVVRDARDLYGNLRVEVRDQGASDTESTPNRDAGNSGTRYTKGPDGVGAVRRCRGLRVEWIDREDGTPRPKCGLFLKATWRFCPTCGTRQE